MTDQVLNEMRTLVECGMMATAKTVQRWIAMIEEDEDDVIRDARAEAHRDA